MKKATVAANRTMTATVTTAEMASQASSAVPGGESIHEDRHEGRPRVPLR